MGTFFYDPRQRMTKELAPGVQARTFWGDRMTLALVTLDPNAVVAPHTHPHEQVGAVISGELEFTIGDETRRLGPGDVYVIPGDVPHGVRVGPGAVELIEVFSPVRENLKY
jgi:quercetin dioxygenase-like cupin family protein